MKFFLCIISIKKITCIIYKTPDFPIFCLSATASTQTNEINAYMKRKKAGKNIFPLRVAEVQEQAS